MPNIVIRKVLASQPLLVEPSDDSDQVILDGVPLRVFAGEKVKTGAKAAVTEQLDGQTIKWVFAEAIGGLDAEKRKGFVDDKFLTGVETDVPEIVGAELFPAEVEKSDFADTCYVQGTLDKTNPAYLYALAFAQSGTQWSDTKVKTDEPAGTSAIGVYQFTKDTWAALLELPEADGLTTEQISSPTAQCIVAAGLATRAADSLKGLVTDHGVSAVDLYLAHLFADDKSFGSKSAAKILDAGKANANQPSTEVAKEIYPDDAVRAAFFKRNKSIFKEDGSATIKGALKAMSDKLAAGFDKVKKEAPDLVNSVPSDPRAPLFGVQFRGNVIAVTDQDIDALARVAHSEVGNFGMFGDAVLADALGAVVDTIFNRVVYPTTEFPKTIQGVIDQPKQFSAINPIGTWKNLPQTPSKNFDLVLNHVQNRARGADSKIKGATHFFNPDTSNPSWGQPIRDNPVAVYGKPKNSHIHGFPKGYHPPESYAIQLGKDGTVFSGDGRHLGPLIVPDKSVSAIVAATLKEWDFWGKSAVPSNVHHRDDEPAFATYVLDTYCKPLGASPSLSDIRNDHYPWSACFVSYVVRQAGVPSSEFAFSEGHSTYIREAIKAQKTADKSKAYWGFRIDDPEAILTPGDLVGAGRGKGMTFEKAQALFNRKGAYESHCDVVVAVRPGEADVIGGNVSDSVTMKRIPLDAKGRIRKKKNFSFVVMKKK